MMLTKGRVAVCVWAPVASELAVSPRSLAKPELVQYYHLLHAAHVVLPIPCRAAGSSGEQGQGHVRRVRRPEVAGS